MSDEVRMEIEITDGDSEHGTDLFRKMRETEEKIASAGVLATYTLQVVGPPSDPPIPGPRRVMALYLPEVEENLTDLLPPGYSVRIKEWDADE